MKVIYARQDIPHSIFLVGPTPRSSDVKTWRTEALQILENLDYKGTVYVPEPVDGKWAVDYLDQTKWEDTALQSSTCIAAWVPRDLDTMPAFTTNVEFGAYVRSGKLLYGRPDLSPKTRYLDWLYKEATGKKPHSFLADLLREAALF